MWFLERLRWDSERLLSPRTGLRRGRARRAAPATCANVLTPDRIPEFCIPPRLAPCAALAARLDSSRGPPAGPDEGDGAGRTDWDPRSQAALSLPHLPRARTAYGFCALLESPHTRRKESLFLGSAGAAALLRPPAPTRAHPRAGPAADAAVLPAPAADAAAAAAPRAPRARRLLRAPEGLLSRALRARRSLGLARAHPGPGSAREDEPPRLHPASSRARGRLRLRLRGAQSLVGAPRAPAAGRDRDPDRLSEDSGRHRAGAVCVEKRPLDRDEPPSGSLLSN
ncbi:C2 calcium-dependent domain-containing protein 4A [Sorex fumeus]|uniref:C2 calcium-dependent domain-containing protein 4A n=1 Tax=Sorex fumeus TaxID=62283 RepID=UPI0024ADCBC5|nr:C2 calcium-dependent domain-containing protein 4A [Sorex fumeus]